MTVPDYAAAFEKGDAGGVIAEVFRPWGGGGKVSGQFTAVNQDTQLTTHRRLVYSRLALIQYHLQLHPQHLFRCTFCPNALSGV